MNGQPDLLSLKLNIEQGRALESMCDFMEDPDRLFFRVDGPAGTGKSTISALFTRRQTELGRTIALAAPTNKATRNLGSMRARIGLPDANIPIGTIFSLLGLVLGKDGEVRELQSTDRDKLDGVNAIVLDERGMVNDMLWNYLSQFAAERRIKVILTGDPYQIPPVGQEQSATDRLGLDAMLTKVERHDNQILNLATHIRECIEAGIAPTIKTDHDENGGVYLLRGKDFYKQIRKAFSSEAYHADGYAFKAMAWRNATVESMNESIRDEMYDGNPRMPFEIGERVVAKGPVLDIRSFIEDGFERFEAGTDQEGSVMSIVEAEHPFYRHIPCHHVVWELDDGGLANSYVVHQKGRNAFRDTKEELLQAARSEGGRAWGAFWNFTNMFAEMAPCHALTVHRAQGSTYRTAFVDVDDILANRDDKERWRLLYTAATRPSKCLILKRG